MSIIRVLGIDPSAVHVGRSIIEFDTETKEYQCLDAGTINDTTDIHKKKYRYPELLEQYDNISQNIKKYIQDWQPTLLGIELPVFTGQAAYNGGFCLQAVGIIRLIAYKLHLKEYGFSPTEVKMILTGKGRADKKAVISKLKEMFPTQKFTTSDDHRADSTMIALSVLHKEFGVRF